MATEYDLQVEAARTRLALEQQALMKSQRHIHFGIMALVTLGIAFLAFWVWDYNRTDRFKLCVEKKSLPADCRGATQP